MEERGLAVEVDNPIDHMETIPGGAIITTGVDRFLKAVRGIEFLDKGLEWSRENSMWYFAFGLACCAIEVLMAAGAARFDLDRFGMMFRATPRQSDLMIVAGTVTKKMAPIVERLYEQMAEPRYVIATGSCAIAGGPFADSYAVLKGVDKIIPVDVYVPGCPPRPEALIFSVMELKKKMREEVAARHPSKKKKENPTSSAVS
jgi:NADH-quinone oxidoreductase subunit B